MTPNKNSLKFAAAILGRIPSEQRESAMATIRAHNPAVAKSIEENLFAFENLADLDGRSLQRLLREVNANSLTMAMRGLDKGTLEKFCAGMSRRTAEDLKENLEDNLESGVRVRLTDVEAERNNILKLANAMAERGEIVLPRADDPLVM